jgi:hypothetical protein
MRWPHESAITRRDEHLAATRRLSMWIAGGATAASLGLAAALGFALPGHTATSAARQPTRTGAGQSSAGQGTGARSAQHRRGLAPPRQAPVNSGAPPTVSSGGS